MKELATVYRDISDGTAVAQMAYGQMNTTNREKVEKVIMQGVPDVVIYCAAWTAMDMVEDDDKLELMHVPMLAGRRTLRLYAKGLTVR